MAEPTAHNGPISTPAITSDIEREERQERARDILTYRRFVAVHPEMNDDQGLRALAACIGADAVAAGLKPADLLQAIERAYRRATRRTRQ